PSSSTTTTCRASRSAETTRSSRSAAHSERLASLVEHEDLDAAAGAREEYDVAGDPHRVDVGGGETGERGDGARAPGVHDARGAAREHAAIRRGGDGRESRVGERAGRGGRAVEVERARPDGEDVVRCSARQRAHGARRRRDEAPRTVEMDEPATG